MNIIYISIIYYKKIDLYYVKISISYSDIGFIKAKT